eukprot:3094829-Amphidinium_carterae.1
MANFRAALCFASTPESIFSQCRCGSHTNVILGRERIQYLQLHSPAMQCSFHLQVYLLVNTADRDGQRPPSVLHHCTPLQLAHACPGLPTQ